jgi:glycerol-3-phosphate dehydrogenase (NAD(P)+)
MLKCKGNQNERKDHSMNPQKIAVLGPGSWGTALSQVLNDNGHEVRIWGNNSEQMSEINEHHTNKRYFKDVVLDEKIKAFENLEEALTDVDAVLFVVPTKVTRLVAQQVAQVLKNKVHLLHASKGLEQGTHARISSILEEEIPASYRGEIVVVSGPSHAEETIVRDITLISAASKDHAEAKYAQNLFSNDYFRLYTNTDVVGVETAGALKNIIAVGAGALHGLGFGDNAKAAIITRGLTEITRLGVALGAEPLTYSGLSGVGDLIVTGTSIHSRNWRAGDALGRGEKLEEIERNMGMVIEGVSTTKAAYELAQQLKIEMPITETIYRVLYENVDAKTAILELMRREAREENEFNQL